METSETAVMYVFIVLLLAQKLYKLTNLFPASKSKSIVVTRPVAVTFRNVSQIPGGFQTKWPGRAMLSSRVQFLIIVPRKIRHVN